MRLLADLLIVLLVSLNVLLVAHFSSLVKIDWISPDFFTLQSEVRQSWVLTKVQFVSQLYIAIRVDQFNLDLFLWVCDIEDNSFVPNGLGTSAYIRFSHWVVLGDFHQVVSLTEVLCVNDMHLKLRIATDFSHWVDVLVFIPLSLFKSHQHFILLACVVDHFSHDFLLSFDESLTRVDIWSDELLPTIQFKQVVKSNYDGQNQTSAWMNPTK